MALATVVIEKGVAEITVGPLAGNIVTSSVPSELLTIFAQLRSTCPSVIILKMDDSGVMPDDDRTNVASTNTVPDACLSAFQTAICELEAMPVPTLAVVQGDCVAGTFQLALCCDLIIAARTSQFSFPETALNLPSLHAGIAQLADRVGQSRALEFAFLGAAFDAEEMERLNIVSRVVDDDRLDQEAGALACRLAAGPTRAYGSVKSMLRSWRSGGLDAARSSVPALAQTFYARPARVTTPA